MMDLKKIAKEHAELFPIADLSGQRIKLLEEQYEFSLAEGVEHMEKELADCLIVCAGIYRFAPKLAESSEKEVYRAILNHSLSVERVENYVNEKWEINKGRKWEYKGGKYHHVGIDGHE